MFIETRLGSRTILAAGFHSGQWRIKCVYGSHFAENQQYSHNKDEVGGFRFC